MRHSPLALPSLSPLRARLINALLSRVLPLNIPLDAGTPSELSCRLELNGGAASSELPAPFSPVATLTARVGDSLWKLELSSLEALALRPELENWRSGTEDAVSGEGEPGASLPRHDFSELPEALCLAVLERLSVPALDKLGRWLGCETGYCSPSGPEPEWAEALPLVLTLPPGRTLYARLFWSDESSARFVLERLENLPLLPVSGPAGPLPDAVLACALEIGEMCLSAREAALLASGDVLLPERWTPEHPRLILPGGAVLACRLENGILSVLGPDATAAPLNGESSDSEVNMSESLSEQSETPEEGGSPLLGREEVNALELPVTFELASLHLRVEELAAITPGHTFALGGEAASVPVYVRVGGKIAARGRLVDVGGIPGVQITATAESDLSAGEAANTEEGN